MPKTINKSAFVREMGSMPAAEIVKKAKQRGFKLSIAHVYTIRSNANRKAASAGHVVRRGPGRPPKARASSALHGTIDGLAKKFVDEILGALRGASLDEILR